MDEQDTRLHKMKRYDRHKKTLCTNILTKKFMKNWKKNKQAKKKIKSLNFVESNAHQKTNARGSFETYNLFFFSLIEPVPT